jgi:hypothetical protein
MKANGRDNVLTKEEETEQQSNAAHELVGYLKENIKPSLLEMGLTSSAKIAILEGRKCTYLEKTDPVQTSSSKRKTGRSSELDSQNYEERLRRHKAEYLLK